MCDTRTCAAVAHVRVGLSVAAEEEFVFGVGYYDLKTQIKYSSRIQQHFLNLILCPLLDITIL